MHFIYMLVIAVAILTILAALALVFGSTKSARPRSLWFLTAAIGEVIWAVSIAIFLSLGSGEADYQAAPSMVLGIYIGALVMDAGLLAYVSWKYKIGKLISTIFVIFAVVLSVLLVYDPSILYSEIILKDAGNSVSLTMGPYYISYLAFFCTLNFIIFCFLFYRITHTKNAKSRHGYVFFLVSLMGTGILSGIFDLMLPLFRYDLIWVGPITIGLTIIGLYFSILKYKMVSINARWLKMLSGVVILSSAFIAYLLIFHLVFSALFKVANPSFQVILLNFIMVAIVLALVPAFSEIMALTKSLIMTKQINLPYIVKKLSQENPKKLNYKEISAFLSENLHFSYVGLLVKGKFYVADDCKIPNDLLAKVAKLSAPAHGAWQDTSKLNATALKEMEISKIAVMTGANGEIVGQMIFGRPVSKSILEYKDLVEIAMIVSLMGTLIENGSRSKS
ncbi:hypothetical protein IJI79_01850 [Candidatus Saccharibacteria bacterium]|nr:hypothetical protein [Candidatus Saccharibacteria bacterium]MBR0424223.1 hypothetical protein [Candidatus Saccharibacteria bacterium]